MHAIPVLQRADRDTVYQALGLGIRRALGRAAAVERLREYDPYDRRTPFRWSAVARFLGPLALLVICVSPTAQSVSAERGTVSAIIHLLVMVALAVGGWFYLREGAWSYRETCVAAYYGTLDKVTRSAAFSAARISSSGESDPPEWLRVRDAQRWARWLTLAALALVIALACAECMTILDCLWDLRVVTTVQPMTAFAVTTRVYGQVLWTLADSIPVLDLPNALHWADPAPFRDSLIVDVTLLVARVAVFGPVIAWIIAAYRGAGFDPRQPATGDKVASRVVRGLNNFGPAVLRREDELIADQLIADRLEAGLAGRTDDKWEHAISFASKALGKELGEEWPPNRVLAYLATQTPGDVGKSQDPVPLIRENTAADSLLREGSQSACLAGPDLVTGLKPTRPRTGSKPPAGQQHSVLDQIEDEISVSVYLDTDDTDAIARVIRHVDELVEALGYDGPINSAVERGSFIRNSWAKIRRSPTSEEARKLLMDAERAAKLRYLDGKQAEVDNEIADALHKVIADLSDIPNASIQAGHILVIKHPGPEGTMLISKYLSELEVRSLERFPGILREPRKTLESLAFIVSNWKEPGPQQGSL